MTSHVTLSSYAICEKALMLGRLKARVEGVAEDGHESEQTPGDSGAQRHLLRCSP